MYNIAIIATHVRTVMIIITFDDTDNLDDGLQYPGLKE
jgi:hypothetical protein